MELACIGNAEDDKKMKQTRLSTLQTVYKTTTKIYNQYKERF